MAEVYVIVGNGIAGLTAAKTIRQIDKKGEIYLIGHEPYYPYNRVRLSKGLFLGLGAERISLQKDTWYDDQNIKLIRGKQVTAIQSETNQIELEDGNKLKYTKLLLSNGAMNRALPIPGLDLKNVFTLRDMHDAQAILKASESAQHVLIVGGGIQGLEIAWECHQQNKKVTILELLPGLMPGNLDEIASKSLEDYIRDQGIELYTSTQAVELQGNEDEVEGVLTDKGIITCDMVVYSIGIQPNLKIVEGTEIERAKGIIVDDYMSTNLPNIYGAGDVAEYKGNVFGLYNIAIGQGKTAGMNMAGQRTPYAHIVPVTTLNAFNISLFSMGSIKDDINIQTKVEKSEKPLQYKKIYIKDNVLVGAIMIGNAKSSPALKMAIEKEKKLHQLAIEDLTIDQFIEQVKGIK